MRRKAQRSRACPQWRGDIGAHIVGALDDAARLRVIGHLAQCPACRADYDELVPLRRWLSRLSGPGLAPWAPGEWN